MYNLLLGEDMWRVSRLFGLDIQDGVYPAVTIRLESWKPGVKPELECEWTAEVAGVSASGSSPRSALLLLEERLRRDMKEQADKLEARSRNLRARLTGEPA